MIVGRKEGDVPRSRPCGMRSRSCATWWPSRRSAARRRRSPLSSRETARRSGGSHGHAGRHVGARRDRGPPAAVQRWRSSPTSTSCRRARGGPAIRFTPVIEDNKLYGRGSGDAKASVAAMLYAAKDVRDGGGHGGRTAARDLGYGEETRNTTMERAVAAAGDIDGGDHRRADESRFRDRAARPHDGRPRRPGRPAACRLRRGRRGRRLDNAVLTLARDLLKLERSVRRPLAPRCSAAPPRTPRCSKPA